MYKTIQYSVVHALIKTFIRPVVVPRKSKISEETDKSFRSWCAWGCKESDTTYD